jgi:(2Fe-2S) ferredoxin
MKPSRIRRGRISPIEQKLAQRKIDAIVTQVGCVEHCYAEPLVIVAKSGYPPICYGYVNSGIASRLVADYIEGDDPCLEFALGALDENELIAYYILPERCERSCNACVGTCPVEANYISKILSELGRW